jgi:hypothetical protein
VVIRPAVFSAFSGIAVGVSTRQGGVSLPPYHSLNLDNRGPDAASNRDENRNRFCAELGFGAEALVRSLQIHETNILVAEFPGIFEGFDAFVTQQKGLLLAVSVADCTPILIYDYKNKAIGAVHAGWRGTVAGIVEKTLEKMRELFGTSGEDCWAYIGPSIDECSFEVGEEVAEQFDVAFKQWNSDRKKYFVDLKKSNAAQLRRFNIPPVQIEISPLSTVLNNDQFFSYRGEQGETGRMLAGIGLI